MKFPPFIKKVVRDPNLTGYDEAGAIYSHSKNLRYVLWRRWHDTLPKVAFIGLNPSTATHLKLDPTIRRCVSFAQGWNCGTLYMLNAFAYRATKPQDMKKAFEPVGAQNDKWIVNIASNCSIVIVAWGNHGEFARRCDHVLALLAKNKIVPFCLGQNANGTPKHPLYLPASTQPVPYAP